MPLLRPVSKHWITSCTAETQSVRPARKANSGASPMGFALLGTRCATTTTTVVISLMRNIATLTVETTLVKHLFILSLIIFWIHQNSNTSAELIFGFSWCDASKIEQNLNWITLLPQIFMFLTQTFLAFICCVDPHECLENEFSCDENKCLPSRFKCDGIADCDDATDEENCSAGSILGIKFPLIHFMFYVVFFITGDMFYVQRWFLKKLLKF